MRRTLRLLVSLSWSGATLACGVAHAQESTTRGLNLALHVQGSSLKPEGGDRSNAVGGGAWIGYGFSRTVQLFLQADRARFDVESGEVQGEWTLFHGDVGVRIHLANSLRSWVPYLQAAFTGRTVDVEEGELSQVPLSEDIGLLGGGFTGGGGIMFYFNETFAADLQLVWTSGRFTDIEVGDVAVRGLELDAQSTRFNVGVSWWP